jgi:hypothetical protein
MLKTFQQNYGWIAHVIFYHHAKIQMQKELLQNAKKKRQDH